MLDQSVREAAPLEHLVSSTALPPMLASTDPWSQDFEVAFAQHIVESNALSPAAVERARHAANSSQERLDLVLSKLGLVSDNDLAAQLSAFLRLPLVTADDVPAQPVLDDLIDEAFVRGNRLLPMATEESHAVVAVVDPFDTDPVRALAYRLGRPIELAVISPLLFETAVRDLFGTRSDPSGSGASAETSAHEVDVERLRDLASEAPVIRLVNQLIAQAVEVGASDIHIEPDVTDVAVRYRVDGALRLVRTLPQSQRAAVTSRIKILARLDIGERRLPQDGRVRLPVRGTNIDLRVATLPTLHGESVVLRILDRTRIKLDFDALGFDAGLLTGLRRALAEPNGIILVTGPTGSGKTTTLYTALTGMAGGDRKIFSVEDPVEYELRGITQVQVQSGIGLDFPHALRSILRQDPDIIMVGEIRDAETARIAIQASLTGHLVLSTLHTNSAAAGIARLKDIGIPAYLIAATVRGILAQRLVRKLCGACSVTHPSEAMWTNRLCSILGERMQRRGEPNIRQARGCLRCSHTGYAGRTTIAEFMVLTPFLQELVQAEAPTTQLENAAHDEGMIPLFAAGAWKAWSGEISPEELSRATTVDGIETASAHDRRVADG